MKIGKQTIFQQTPSYFPVYNSGMTFVESDVNLTGKSYAKLSGVNTTIELTDGESSEKQTGFVSILASNQVLPLHFP